ncbi:MAG: DUF2334 domain-containing protein [Pseudomonas sp.]
MAERYLCLVLHDVTPQTWADYQPLLEAVDDLGQVPTTLLVVPNFHHRQPLSAHPDFRRQLERRLACGDELALHGYYHCDDEPSARTVRAWWMRRIYTSEGEFYTLDQDQAQRRLDAGRELFQQFGWPLAGFVAPAWLMSAGTRRALEQSGLRYTSDTQQLYRLPDFTPIAAPGLVWSARSAWRRGASWLASESAAHLYRQAPLIRLGVHPVDMRREFSRCYWLRLLQRLLEEGRIPLTKLNWLNRQPLVLRAGR